MKNMNKENGGNGMLTIGGIICIVGALVTFIGQRISAKEADVALDKKIDFKINQKLKDK